MRWLKNPSMFFGLCSNSNLAAEQVANRSGIVLLYLLHEQHIIAAGNCINIFESIYFIKHRFAIGKIGTVAHAVKTCAHRGRGYTLQAYKIETLKRESSVPVCLNFTGAATNTDPED